MGLTLKVDAHTMINVTHRHVQKALVMGDNKSIEGSV